MTEIRQWGGEEIQRAPGELSDRTEIVGEYGMEALGCWLDSWHGPVAIEQLLGSVRTIPMSPAPEYGYDPIPLIRPGEKTHTLRGSARILGTVNQVAVGGVRIPLWLRWTARQRVTWEDVCTEEFAREDGIRPEYGSAADAMERLFMSFHDRRPRPDKRMWVLHFQVWCDLMDELKGRWEL